MIEFLVGLKVFTTKFHGAVSLRANFHLGVDYAVCIFERELRVLNLLTFFDGFA